MLCSLFELRQQSNNGSTMLGHVHGYLMLETRCGCLLAGVEQHIDSCNLVVFNHEGDLLAIQQRREDLARLCSAHSFQHLLS